MAYIKWVSPVQLSSSKSRGKDDEVAEQIFPQFETLDSLS